MGLRAARDEEFDRFVVEAYAPLVRFGGLLVGDRSGGEDLVQTALVKVYGSWARIEDKEAAAAYTRRTMVRVASRWRRRRWNGERPSDIEPADLTTDDRSGDVASADAVRRALLALPVPQRAVLLLRYVEDRSEADTAELLGIPTGTVKSRAARALSTLRQLGILDEDGVVVRERA